MKITVENNQCVYGEWKFPVMDLCKTPDELLFYTLSKVEPSVSYEDFISALREFEKEYW